MVPRQTSVCTCPFPDEPGYVNRGCPVHDPHRCYHSSHARWAVKRDLIWSLLWQLTHEGAGAYVRDVYDAWLDGRDECGIVYVDDYIGNPDYFRHALNRLVADGRAQVSRAKGRHPLYTAIER